MSWGDPCRRQPVRARVGPRVVRATVILFASALLHASLLVWIASKTRTRHVVELVTEVPRDEGEPIEVVLLPPEPEPARTAAATADAPRTRAAGRAAARARTAGEHRANDEHAEHAEPGGGSEPSGRPGGTSLFKMRGADLALDAAAAERIANAGGAARADEVSESDKLEKRPGGRAVVRDTVTTMNVAADGKAKFRDKPDLDVEVSTGPGGLLDPELRKLVREHLVAWIEDPYEGTRYGRSQDLPPHLQAVPGACDAWGAELCDDPMAPAFEKRLREIKRKLGGGAHGNLDLTAYLHRKFVGDPYASRKLKLLDDTRAERVEMGIAYRAQQRMRSSEFMQRNVERLWASVADPVARRAALFELWDECGEDEAGVRARAIVIGWIRGKLPRGSEHAFTDDEIATLQTRRTSAQPFEPYER